MNRLCLTFLLVLVMYAFQLMADLSENLKFLGHLSPMKWASAADVLSRGDVPRGYLIAMLALNAASLALAYAFYKKKDILV